MRNDEIIAERVVPAETLAEAQLAHVNDAPFLVCDGIELRGSLAIVQQSEADSRLQADKGTPAAKLPDT